MKTREEAARYIEDQFRVYGKDYLCPLPKGAPTVGRYGAWHYGKQDVRALMDFIFEGPPATKEQEIQGKDLRNGRRQ